MTSSQTTNIKPEPATKLYKWIGNNVQDFDADGKVIMVGPGETLHLGAKDLESLWMKELLKNGLLLEATGGE